jgi:membrane protein YqaA with SNARE-associated domain
MDRLTGFVRRVIQAIQPIAEQFGAPGLALVAFFDSSFLSLPEVADALLVVSVIHRPSYWIYYAIATTAGSVAGCYALYALARKGGEAFLRKRFRERHVEQGLTLFRRFGLLAVVVPAILPPPAPFKIFVLLAGVADVRPGTFLLAVTVGRLFRYGMEAWLAYAYGDEASRFIRENLAIISLWTALIVAVLGIGVVVWRRRRAA